MSDKPLFVPVAFSEEEALHLLGAARAVIQAGAIQGDSERARPLVAAMVRLAEARDRAREGAADD